MSRLSDTHNALSDILLGYSVCLDYSAVLNHKIVYIKHFTPLDIAKINNSKDFFLNLARKEGLSTREEREKYIIDQELWDSEKDKEINTQKNFIDRLRLTKKNLMIEEQVNQINQQIKESNDKIHKLENEKESLLGMTVESFASKKINELYVKNSLYSDVEFHNKILDDETFEYLDDSKLIEIVKTYNNKMANLLDHKNIKRVSLLDDYFRLFIACNDNAYYLYGRPIIFLTNYQIDIFEFAKHYKNILSQSKTPPPHDILEDPDKLDDWFNLNKNTENVMQNNQNAAGVAIVGASSKDIDRASPNKQIISGPQLKDLAGKSFQEIIAAHGM